PFMLPGGDKVVKEPRRAAVGLCYELQGEAVFERSDWAGVNSFSSAELGTLRTMLARRLNSPWTTRAGRLFDRGASLSGLRQRVAFEGQAAMELEFALDGAETSEAYRFGILDCNRPTTSEAEGSETPHVGSNDRGLVLDWGPAIESLLSDMQSKTPLQL